MRNYKDYDEDFRLVPMNIRGNRRYSFMPMNNINQNPIPINQITSRNPNHNCCCMHNYEGKPSYYNNNYYRNQIFLQNNEDNIMVKTLITVKKKSDLFD